MADDLDHLHVEAAMSLLRADLGALAYPDADGFTPPLPARPYVRVHWYISRQSDAAGNALDGISGSWTTYLYAHGVGDNEYSATAMQMRVRSAWLDKRPTVPGRDCGLLREDQCLPPQRDDTTDATVFDAVVVYRFTSN